MSFVSRLANYVLNEFLVDALANSKTFQRFAETTSKAKENAEKVAEEARATAARMMRTEEAAKKTPPPKT